MLDLAAKRSAQGWVERRDPRFKVLVRVSLRWSGAPIDACVRDVSRRGMLIQAGLTPARGAIIEVMGPFPPVVARVVWASGRQFGVITQGNIAISDFLAAKTRTSIDGDPAESGACATAQADPDPAERYRHIGRILQFAAVIAGGGALALAMAQLAFALLTDIASAIETAM